MPDHYASSPRAWTMIVQSPTECVVGTGHGLAILAKPYKRAGNLPPSVTLQRSSTEGGPIRALQEGAARWAASLGTPVGVEATPTGLQYPGCRNNTQGTGTQPRCRNNTWAAYRQGVGTTPCRHRSMPSKQRHLSHSTPSSKQRRSTTSHRLSKQQPVLSSRPSKQRPSDEPLYTP